MQFIRLFDTNKNELAPITNMQDLCITESVDAIQTIEFNISGYDAVAANIQCEGYLEYDNQRYVIKEKTQDADNLINVYGTQDVDDLRATLRRSFIYTNITAATAIRYALMDRNDTAENGAVPNWRLQVVDNITRKRDIDLSYTTVWEILQEVKDIWHCELKFDSMNYIIYLYGDRKIGKPLADQEKPYYFYDDFNINELELNYDTSDFANIIWGYGEKTTSATEVLFSYKATATQAKTSSHPSRTVYYSDTAKTKPIAYRYEKADGSSTEPKKLVQCVQVIVDGTSNDKFYYDSTRNYNASGSIESDINNVCKIVKSQITTNSTKKTVSIKRTTTKLLRLKNASNEAKAQIESEFGDLGFKVSGSSIYTYNYTNKHMRQYLYDDRYNDEDALLRDAAYMLREKCQPNVSITAKISDFSAIGDYRNISVGDTIKLRSRDKNLDINYRVIEIKKYIDNYEETELTLSSRRKTLADSQAIQKRFMSQNTNSNGSLRVSSSTTSALNEDGTSTTIYNTTGIDASLLQGIISPDGDRLTIENIDASHIISGTIDASQIQVVNLDASNITTGTLDASSANIINLNAKSIDAESLTAAIIEAGALTADTIGTIELSASQITSGEIDATNITIKNINGHNINNGTILAEALAQEVITNLQGTKVFYTPTEPTEGVTEGSIWYKTVSNGSDAVGHIYEYKNNTWVERPLDATTFLAGAITSREISSEYVYGGTIYADQIGVSSVIDKNKFSGFTISEDAIYRNNAGLGVSGNGNIYLGVNGFSLSNKLVYNASNDKLVLGDGVSISWGNITGTENIATKSYVADAVSGVSVSVPSYIKSTYIDSTQIISPTISSGTINSAKVDTDSIYIKNGAYIYDSDMPSDAYKFITFVADSTSDTTIRMGRVSTNGYSNLLTTIDFKDISQERNINLRADTVNVLSSGIMQSNTYANLNAGVIYGTKLYLSDMGTTTTTSTTSTTYPLVRYTAKTNQLVKYASSSSSRSIKNSISEDIAEELNPQRLYNLKVKQFKYNSDYLEPIDQRYDKLCIGLIAEEVQEVYPIAADEDEEGNAIGWNEKLLIPAMLKLIQQQKAEIDELRERINAL